MMQKGTTLMLALIVSFVFAVSASPVVAADKQQNKQKVAAGKDAKSAPAASEAEAKKENASGQKGNKNDKAAVVNGTVITRGDVDSEMARYERQMAMTGQETDPAQMAELKKKVVDGLIGREVLKQEAQRLGVKADEAEVNEQIEALKKRFPNEGEFKTALTKMNLTEADLKSQFTQDLGIRKMLDQEVTSKISVSAEDAKAFYDKNPEMFKAPEMVRASHILIKVEPNASAEDKAKAREKLVEIQKRLKNGEDFATLAKENSDCPSKANGGDLDFFQKGQMVGPFEEAAFAMKPGDTSDIVETQFGFHIIKVTDKKEAGTVSFDEMKGRIEQHLKQEKASEQVTKYVDQLKSKAKIETFEM